MLRYLLIIALVAGCASAPEKKEGQLAPAVAGAIAKIEANTTPEKIAEGQAYERFQRFLKSFAAGNTKECADFFDQAMIGRQELINSLNKSKTTQKIQWVRDTNSKTETLGENTAVISFAWDKSYLNLAGSEVTKSGKARFFMQKTGDEWKLVGLTGDNLLLP